MLTGCYNARVETVEMTHIDQTTIENTETFQLDEEFIAFENEARNDYNFEIHLVNTDGKNSVKLTD
jgi:hypothetical protein